MSNGATPRVRRSIQALQDDYAAGNKKPLEDLMRAWKGIKELPPDDPKSFFVLGGYHGEPFRGAGWGNASYWGRLLHAWQHSLPALAPCLSGEAGRGASKHPGLRRRDGAVLGRDKPGFAHARRPWALTQKTFVLDNKTIDNPLRSFVFPANINDNIGGDEHQLPRIR
jgi:tyrosinase